MENVGQELDKVNYDTDKDTLFKMDDEMSTQVKDTMIWLIKFVYNYSNVVYLFDKVKTSWWWSYVSLK